MRAAGRVPQGGPASYEAPTHGCFEVDNGCQPCLQAWWNFPPDSSYKYDPIVSKGCGGTKQACAFWLQQKFNPSPELLSMRTLADGKKGNVTVVQNAKLTWESDAAWDTEKYKKMMDKHFADMDKLDTEETEHKPSPRRRRKRCSCTARATASACMMQPCE